MVGKVAGMAGLGGTKRTIVSGMFSSFILSSYSTVALLPSNSTTYNIAFEDKWVQKWKLGPGQSGPVGANLLFC